MKRYCSGVDLRAGDRLAEIVGEPAGDDTAARQRERDLLDELTVEHVEQRAAALVAARRWPYDIET